MNGSFVFCGVSFGRRLVGSWGLVDFEEGRLLEFWEGGGVGCVWKDGRRSLGRRVSKGLAARRFCGR